jgi:hypothetical protein
MSAGHLEYVTAGEPYSAADLDRAVAALLLDIPDYSLRALIVRHYDALVARAFRSGPRLSWRTVKGRMIRIFGELVGWRER